MKTLRNISFALLALASVNLFADAYGIEVLGIEVLQSGQLAVETRSHAPAGAYVEAVMVVGGSEMVVDVTPVNPQNGRAMVTFPQSAPGNKVVLRDRAGAVVDEDGVVDFD